jgi:hypothetical protein
MDLEFAMKHSYRNAEKISFGITKKRGINQQYKVKPSYAITAESLKKV